MKRICLLMNKKGIVMINAHRVGIYYFSVFITAI